MKTLPVSGYKDAEDIGEILFQEKLVRRNADRLAKYKENFPKSFWAVSTYSFPEDSHNDYQENDRKLPNY